MKKFNLEDYNNGAGAITRGGREVINLFERESPYGDLAVVVCNTEGRLKCFEVWEGGGFYKKGEIINEHTNDLFMKQVEIEAWINIYKDPSISVLLWATEEQAKAYAGNADLYIKSIKIKWEE